MVENLGKLPLNIQKCYKPAQVRVTPPFTVSVVLLTKSVVLNFCCPVTVRLLMEAVALANTNS